jgi:hypothetical protein
VAVDVLRTAVRAWRDEFGSVVAHVLVEARNPGPGMVEMRGVDARYEISAADGAVLHRGAFVYALPTIVPEGETAYFVDTVRLDFAESTELGTLEVEVGPATTTTTAETALVVSDVTWERMPGDGLEVSGTVRNPFEASVPAAMVGVVLLDDDGGLLGAVYDATDIGGIEPGGDAQFSADYPRTPPIDPAAVGSVHAVAFPIPAP